MAIIKGLEDGIDDKINIAAIDYPASEQPEEDSDPGKPKPYMSYHPPTARDFDEVIECAEEILPESQEYQQEIADTIIRGGNPALTMYHIIKSDPKFKEILPKAQTRLKRRGLKTSDDVANEKEEASKKEAAKKTQQKIEENTKKEKTSGAQAGAGEGEPLETLDEFLKLTDDEFAKLPTKKRQQLLQKYG